MTLHRPWSARGVAGHDDETIVHLTPADAGWAWTGLSVVQLAPRRPRVLRTGDSEVFVLPLSGGLQVSVTDDAGVATGSFELVGRDSVFTAVSDFAYIGRDSVITLRSSGIAEVALPSSRCHHRRPPAYGPADAVPVEVRGAGNSTRQVNNFGVPGVWDGAEKLICCELITPPGNWSSYPPHKHDASEPCEVVNEEIYYYRIAGKDQITPGPTGFGYHRTYTGPEHEAAGLAAINETVEVRDHDVVLVPHGYHGPCIAAPGYPMYYLNVMAGPAAQRELAFCDDREHGWVRNTWEGVATDPRCPVTSAAGRVQSNSPQTLQGEPR